MRRIHEETRLYKTFYGYNGMFRRRLYCGDLEWAGELIENWIEPCVSRELWEQVAEQRRVANELSLSPRTGTGSYTLTGWLLCGVCEGRMTGHTCTTRARGHRYTYRRYFCRKAKMTMAGHTNFYPHAFDIEREVYGILSREVLTPEAMFSMLQGTSQGQQERDQLVAEIARLDAEVEGLDKRIGRLVDQVERYGPDSGIAQRLQQRRQERQVTASKIARLERKLDRARPDPVPENVIRAFCDHAQDVLLVGNVPEVREVLRPILDSVHVWPDGRGLVRYMRAFGEDRGSMQEAEFRWCGLE